MKRDLRKATAKMGGLCEEDLSARTPSFRHQTSRKFFSHSNFPKATAKMGGLCEERSEKGHS